MSRANLLNNVELRGNFVPFTKNRPSARAMATFNAYNNYLYLIGGVSNERLFEVWVCDLNNDYEWIQIHPDGESINPRMGHTSVFFKNCFYIFGGNIKDVAMAREDIIEYDIGNWKIT